MFSAVAGFVVSNLLYVHAPLPFAAPVAGGTFFSILLKAAAAALL